MAFCSLNKRTSNRTTTETRKMWLWTKNNAQQTVGKRHHFLATTAALRAKQATKPEEQN